MKNPFRSLRKLLLILFGIIGFGTTGYILIEDYPFRDALYMTMQVVSTVGFNEVVPFKSYGKEFTIILIVMSFSTRFCRNFRMENTFNRKHSSILKI